MPDVATPQPVPSGCQHCGIGHEVHARQFVKPVGWHAFVEPTQEQIAERMKARRAARIVIPVDSAFADLAHDRITDGGD